MLRRALITTGLTTTAVLTGYMVYRFYKSRGAQADSSSGAAAAAAAGAGGGSSSTAARGS